jgi:hypothetical protein
LIGVIATGLTGVGVANAAWTAPVNVSPAGPTGHGPQVEVDSAGNAIVAWLLGGSSNSVQARARAADGTFGPIKTIASSTPTLVNWDFAMAGSGGGDFTWIQNDGTNDRTAFRILSSSGNLTAVRVVSPPNRDARRPAIGLNDDGVAVIAWEDVSGRIFARLRLPDGSLGTVLKLSPIGELAQSPQVAVDGQGNGYVTWFSAPRGGGQEEVYGRQILSDRTLGPLQQISVNGGGTYAPLVGVAEDGTDVILWDGLNDAGLQVRTRTQDGVLGPVQTVSNTSSTFGSQDLAVALNGNAIIAWGEGGDVVYARRLGPTGSLSPTQTISSISGLIQSPSVAVDSMGNSIIVWPLRPTDNNYYEIEARQRAVNGTLGPESAIGGFHSAQPDVDMNATGQAVATWVRSGRVQVSAGP